jgi:DnaD/phage-associated family protein
MATGKRYYWIKVKESFITSDTVDFLMSQPNGASYVVLYQMLCLKTINTGGRFVRHIGEVVIPYDAEKIQRDCKYFSIDTIHIAMQLYKALGLIYEDVDGVLVLANHDDMVGSETDYAEKNRRMRSKKVPPALPAAPAESNLKTGRPPGEVMAGGSAVDDGLAKIIQTYEQNIGGFPRIALDRLQKWRTEFADDVVIEAICEAALSNGRSWKYIDGILRNWKAGGIKTVGDVKQRRSEFEKAKEDKHSAQGGRQSAMEDLAELFAAYGGEST